MTTDEIEAERKEKIQELRKRIADISVPEYDTDHYLGKWLIARSFDVDRAEEMLRKHARFAKANGLDKITEDYVPAKATNYFHTAMLGYDKEGSVVRILHIGGSDLRGAVLSISKTDCLKFAAYVLITDGLRQKRERANDTLCDKQVYIIDLEGLAWRDIIHRPVVERALMLLKNYEANYPENLKVVYIVNAPGFFSFIYSWLKSFLPESILSKIEILTQEECGPILNKAIDPEILPASLGGARKDPDGNPNCESLYVEPLGATVPESMMLYNQLDVLNNDPDAQKTVVDYKSYFKVEITITRPNCNLLWDFTTSQYDIRMGLSYKPDENSEVEEIIPLHRVESHRIPETGNFTCLNPGIYEIMFDNTYSWMTRKELTYKISVKLPEEMEDE